MLAHKTARMAQKQQSSASGGALLSAMTFAAEKTFTVEGIRIPDTIDSDERHIRGMPHKGIHELSERS
jgi:hypothetical protein